MVLHQKKKKKKEKEKKSCFERTKRDKVSINFSALLIL